MQQVASSIRTLAGPVAHPLGLVLRLEARPRLFRSHLNLQVNTQMRREVVWTHSIYPQTRHRKYTWRASGSVREDMAMFNR